MKTTNQAAMSQADETCMKMINDCIYAINQLSYSHLEVEIHKKKVTIYKNEEKLISGTYKKVCKFISNAFELIDF